MMNFLCWNKCVKKKELSFNVNPNSKLFYLNNDKNRCYNSCGRNDKYNYSFDELHNIAIDKAVNIITCVDDILKKEKINNKKIEDLFGNKHYGTGMDCDKNYYYKYFKF